MHPWLDFFRKLQKLTSFGYNWSTSKEYKILDAVMLCPTNCLQSMPKPQHRFHRRLYTKVQVWLWFYIVRTVFIATTMCHFLYVLLRENHKINAVCFPSFHNGCSPEFKLLWKTKIRQGFVDRSVLWRLTDLVR